MKPHWLDRIVGTRAALMVVGAVLLLLAYPTAESSNLDDLPGRSLLVLLSIFGGIVGIGAGFVGANKDTRSWVGVTLTCYALIRAGTFLLRALRDWDGFADVYANSSGAIAWLLLAYLGLLIWVRGHRRPERRDDE